MQTVAAEWPTAAGEHYLLETIICVPLFCGFGLGIGPRYGMLGVYSAWAVIFSIQILMSQLWLRHFQFGPVEWIWRRLTYS